MRLYLLPISTRRTLIFCQRKDVTPTGKQSYLDWGTTKAANLWADWEKKESGWQKKVVEYGNKALRGIPYEEWGLKSIPPLSSRAQEEESKGAVKVEVEFPKTLIPESQVLNVLRTLGTERQALHKQRMIWSIVGMPIVAPFALVPVIPNIPFFYLVFRAWSHWRALGGSKHIEYLLDKKLIQPAPSKILDELYASGKRPFDSSKAAQPSAEETMVLHESDGQRISEKLEIPELFVELDRAVYQVEKALKTEKEQKEQETRADAAEKEKKN